MSLSFTLLKGEIIYIYWYRPISNRLRMHIVSKVEIELYLLSNFHDQGLQVKGDGHSMERLGPFVVSDYSIVALTRPATVVLLPA